MQQEDTYLAALAKRSPLFDGIGTDNLSALFSCLGTRRVRLAKVSGADVISVDVEANEDSVVLLLKAARIVTPCENVCAFHARLVRNIMRTLAVKTLELNRKIDILSHRSTQDRLMAYLRSVAQLKGSAEFDIPFDRQQLADYLCVERSALSAEISRLSRLGLITSRKNNFTLRRAV